MSKILEEKIKLFESDSKNFTVLLWNYENNKVGRRTLFVRKNIANSLISEYKKENKRLKKRIKELNAQQKGD